MIKNLENTEFQTTSECITGSKLAKVICNDCYSIKRKTEMRYPGGDPENGPAECHYVDTGTPVQEDKEKC